MGVRHVMGTGTYLGRPSMVGRRKKAIFSFIKDRIWKRINSWRGRPLSKACKEIMIKSVLQAIPSYGMSVFILPDTLVEDIEKMLNAFWWGGASNNKGIRWLAWDSLTYPKNEGGLRFRDFKAFNMAMVAKQGWHIMNNQNTLFSKVFKAKYFPNSSFLAADLGTNPSLVWRSLWTARQVLVLGSRWRIGDGSNINVMREPWLRGVEGGRMEAPQEEHVYSLVVKDLMDPLCKQWDRNKIDQLFTDEITDIILQVPLVGDVTEDGIVWK
ncbi:uncharacterized mitochondrial protein AtMg00310-like [Vicia villosa]|uniref:uncharacterized mitochondrial protein AtMg00310-like n=1 Tax=Vicia villosa TaxID=3911 RepID=UPI00273B16C0|nr:uncharacterized mitochondrial protein AtMg00310-like [Vicia villosa]